MDSALFVSYAFFDANRAEQIVRRDLLYLATAQQQGPGGQGLGAASSSAPFLTAVSCGRGVGAARQRRVLRREACVACLLGVFSHHACH